MSLTKIYLGTRVQGDQGTGGAGNVRKGGRGRRGQGVQGTWGAEVQGTEDIAGRGRAYKLAKWPFGMKSVRFKLARAAQKGDGEFIS